MLLYFIFFFILNCNSIERNTHSTSLVERFLEALISFLNERKKMCENFIRVHYHLSQFLGYDSLHKWSDKLICPFYDRQKILIPSKVHYTIKIIIAIVTLVIIVLVHFFVNLCFLNGVITPCKLRDCLICTISDGGVARPVCCVPAVHGGVHLPSSDPSLP